MKSHPSHTVISSDPLDDEQNWVTANLSGQIDGTPMKMRVDIPKTLVHPRRLLPIYQRMTDTFVQLAVNQTESAGLAVSCRAGCGACCRQLVPISEIEARQLSDLVAAMPEAQRKEIHRRFDEARVRLLDGKLLDILQEPDHFSDQALDNLAPEYFKLSIPCPFLEEESCSIHPDRPLACREYLVSSPAENCLQPAMALVEHVPMQRKMSSAVIRLSEQRSPRLIPYVPMILSLDWVAQNPDAMTPRTGPDILTSLAESLFGRKLKTADPANAITNAD